MPQARPRKADGAPRLTPVSFYAQPSEGLRAIEVVIPAAEYAKMAKGVPYTLHPVNGRPGYAWKVKEGLTLTRE